MDFMCILLCSYCIYGLLKINDVVLHSLYCFSLFFFTALIFLHDDLISPHHSVGHICQIILFHSSCVDTRLPPV